jgi:hypothetical protein
MNRELVVAERLNAGRLALRGVGAGLALAESIGLAYLTLGLVRAGGGHALPGWNSGLLGWAVGSPVAAVSVVVALACPSVFALLAATWWPTRRRFRFDRANAYEIVGRYRVRHRLEDIEILAGPPRLVLAGRTHQISGGDWDRVTSFYRALANERSPSVRPAAMGAPSVKQPRKPRLTPIGAAALHK